MQTLPRTRRSLWTLAIAAACALTACSAPPSTPQARTSPSTATTPQPGTSGSAGSHTPAPVAKPTTAAQVIAGLPQFGPPPTPVPVTLPGGPTAEIFYHMPVTAKVAFLTMDDGLDQMPVDLQVMQAAHIPFTMFLIAPVAARNPAFFKQLETDGGVIEDHTITHTDLKGKPYAFQRHEICGARTSLAGEFGQAPTLFRPPYGDYDQNTLKAVHDCGMQAAFYWTETVNDGKVFYQTSVHHIRPGDIILMHFRPAFPQDVLAALTAIHRAGLTPALLTSYMPTPVP
jgi:peptidoglycan/xylan/chitin deacetylase (PgdA/CDA1 family)